MPPSLPQTVLRKYRVKENRVIADGSFALFVEAVDPADAIPAFQAGQWVYLHLLEADGSSWARAAYSIANAPSTGTQVIELGIKTAGDFTQRASMLKPGDEVLLQGPWGVFTWKKDAQRAAYFAGGIGVTPLLSMALEAAATAPKDQPFEIVFVYSFRLPQEAAYLTELHDLMTRDARIRFIPVCTGKEVAGWEGERGRINADTLARLLPDGADDYAICGPDPFMDDLKQILITRGVEPKKIRRESFG
jgi:ferredoxin-NADP reductase